MVKQLPYERDPEDVFYFWLAVGIAVLLAFGIIIHIIILPII
jgi:hypothetical protein